MNMSASHQDAGMVDSIPVRKLDTDLYHPPLEEWQDEPETDKVKPSRMSTLSEEDSTSVRQEDTGEYDFKQDGFH